MQTPEAYSSCSFYVEISELPQAVFSELSGLQVDIETQEYEEGGNNGYVHCLPGRAKVGHLTLKRGMTSKNEFYAWIMNIAQGKIDRRNITVKMFDAKGGLMSKWDFVNAYPVKWSGPQFVADGTVVAIESIELAHDGFVAQ